MAKILLDNFSGDFGDSGSVGTAVNTDGGNKTVLVKATNWGSGGTVAIQGSDDDTTWITLSVNSVGVTYTANEIRMIDRLGQGMQVRAAVTAGTGIVGLTVQLFD